MKKKWASLPPLLEDLKSTKSVDKRETTTTA